MFWFSFCAFPFSALTLLVGWQEGYPACKNSMLVCWWWWFDWRFARPVVQWSQLTTSIILCFNKHRLTHVHLENGRLNGEKARVGQSMFWPSKMLCSFIQSCCCVILQVSHVSEWKELIFWRCLQAVRNWDCWLFENCWRMGLFYFLCIVLSERLQRTQVHAHNTRTHKGLSPSPPIWNTCITTVDTIQLLKNTFFNTVSLSLF